MAEGAPGPLGEWLALRGLEAYRPVLEENAIDLDALFELEYSHLQEMGLPLGIRLKILKAVAEEGGRKAGERDILSLRREAAERRQITAMFCDIVGYTHLSGRIDLEETRRLLNDYWARIEDTVQAHQGHVAQYLGDGALIYFGYPATTEDDAERAIGTALALLATLAESAMEGSTELHIRIGIATGTVVVGETAGRLMAGLDTLAIGPTLNLASRLQAVARPGTVVVDEATRQLVGDLFGFEPLGSVEIAGFDTPVRPYRVTGKRAVRSRFEAQRFIERTAILGRAGETGTALGLWRRALERHGRMLLVTGEPGIGKSHFSWELARQISEEGAEVLHLQCTPRHTDSPFHPLIEGLTRLSRDGFFRAPGAPSPEGLSEGESRLLADLVGTGPKGASASPDGPGPWRQRTLAALVAVFVDRSKSGPFLVVIEDLHWCDPSTLEVLDGLLARLRDLPLMVLATTRPGLRHRFAHSQNLTEMHLPRLGRADIDALVARIFSDEDCPPALLDFIAERTDGVPLFAEELAKALRETDRLGGEDAALPFGADLHAIPTSLHGILMERLDKLASAKRVAQVAACIGRDFDDALLGRVAGMPAAELAQALERMISSELVLAKPLAGGVSYSFKHALVRDAAYSSLLFTERQRIHGLIAEALATIGDPSLVGPEVLAYHLTSAQDVVPAIGKWHEAAVAAKLRSANNEAIAHLEKALRLLDQLPNAAERNRREFSLLIEMIAPYRATRGFAAHEVAAVTERAIHLADEARDVRGVLPLLYNQWVYKFVTAHRDVCWKLAEAFLERSDYDEDNLLRMTGLRALAVTDFTRGRLEPAVTRFDASLALYAPGHQAEITQAVGLDARVVALGYKSLACWCLGQREEARNSIAAALEHARAVEHASTTIFATYHHTLLMGVLERDADVLRANGETLRAMGEEQNFSMWAVCGKLLKSMGDCLAQPTRQGIKAVEENLSDFQDMGLVYRPTYECFIAEAWLRLRERDLGLERIERARRLIRESGERWYESEICRVEAELHLLHDADIGAARALLDQAIGIARAQGSVRFEERAATALAGLVLRESGA